MKCSECNRVAHDPSCSSANVSPSAERILSDLIAELRGNAEGHPGNWWDCVDEQRTMAVRAEARLREATGDE